jgi:hypothetical protein
VPLTVVRRNALVIDRSAPDRDRHRAHRSVCAAGAGSRHRGECWRRRSWRGLILVVVAKVTLGRSFGVLPANRGVVASGVYGWVRHPIYAGYLLSDVGFLCAHPLGWNVLVLGGSALAQVWRLLLEERTLATDPQYASYLQRVKWRLLPIVF